MRTYELIVLLHPDLEIDPAAPIEKIEKLVETNHGKVVKRDNWGKKRLAYRLKKHDFAVYVYFELSVDPAYVRPLNDAILLTEEVVRHIMVSRVPAKRVTGKKAKVKKVDEAKTEEQSEENREETEVKAAAKED